MYQFKHVQGPLYPVKLFQIEKSAAERALNLVLGGNTRLND